MNTNQNLFSPQLVIVHVVQSWSEEKKCLLLRRCGKFMAGNWQMVAGKINANETAIHAAMRELKEETGLISDRIYSADYLETFYDHAKNAIFFAPVFVAFIDMQQNVSLSAHEHDAYEWVNFEKAYDLLEFRGQREALRHIVEQFIDKSPNNIFLI